MPELHLLARKDVGFWGDSLSLYIYTKDVGLPGQIGVAGPLAFKWFLEGAIIPQETSIGGLKLDAATRLMDSLWEAGVRPSYAMTNDQAEIKAMRAHIEDLRKLLWNRVGMEAQP